MTQPLDEYRPDDQTACGIKRELLKAGGEESSIPMGWLEVISAATFRWIAETTEGQSKAFKLLSFEETKGRPDRIYEVKDHKGRKVETVPFKDIAFAGGCFIRGIPFPMGLVSAEESPKHRCDDCGSRVHCVKETTNSRQDRIESYCNGCLTQSEDLRNKDLGDREMCLKCPDTSCAHNHIHFGRLDGDAYLHQW